jgi:two-component system sensor histidine kinase TctE
MSLQPRSLQLRLALQFTLLFAVGAAVVIIWVAGKASNAEANLDKYELQRRAAELASNLVLDQDRRLALRQQSDPAAIYGAPGYNLIFSVRDGAGSLIASSLPEFGALTASWPLASEDPAFFRLKAFGPAHQDYRGLVRFVESPKGRVTLFIATASAGDQFVSAVLNEFLSSVAWICSIKDGLVLLFAIAGLRYGLRSLHEVSSAAAQIGPRHSGARLPLDTVPSELKPLIQAFNQALQRLDDGLVLQRRFTANAAHELRTPLAVLTAELEALEGNGNIARLREDAARMNRLVNQLLRAARLENIPLDVGGRVELNSVAAAAVAQLAPVAISEHKTLALSQAHVPVMISGNAEACADAVRNLIENAIGFTEPGTEVEVTVDVSGRLTVSDRGPGVPGEYRERIFERFWRGNCTPRPGAGLGLAIVREIMNAHHGHVLVGDNPGGGALFTLVFTSKYQELSFFSSAPAASVEAHRVLPADANRVRVI